MHEYRKRSARRQSKSDSIKDRIRLELAVVQATVEPRRQDQHRGAADEHPKQMPWPHLYRVTLRGIKGEKRVDTVLSWLNEHKAVAMAVEAHASGWIGPKKTWPVYSVEVEDLGLAPKDKRGMVGSGPPGTFEDRSEF